MFSLKIHIIYKIRTDNFYLFSFTIYSALENYTNDIFNVAFYYTSVLLI
jgi:hypothetical protein